MGQILCPLLVTVSRSCGWTSYAALRGVRLHHYQCEEKLHSRRGLREDQLWPVSSGMKNITSENRLLNSVFPNFCNRRRREEYLRMMLLVSRVHVIKRNQHQHELAPP